MRAIWKGTILAESDQTLVVENNHYFPPQAIQRTYFKPSPTHTLCGWKGEASYYNVEVGDAVNPDAAWYYPEPKAAAANIKNYVAFWRGVEITE